MKYSLFILIIMIITACKNNERDSHQSLPAVRDTLKYATGFSIARHDDVVYLTVNSPYQGATAGFTYALVPHAASLPAGINNPVIRIPVRSIACTSTTHIPLLDYLGETHKLVGFPGTDLISSVAARKQIDMGNVKDLGVDKGLNLEMLASLRPDMLMGYSMDSNYGQFKKIEELGIPVVINSEYLEKHPLGRAEWIKFMALFFDKESEADSIFNAIEKSYNETAALAREVHHRPTVLSGIMYGDAWFLPGGRNYASTILRDAGCDYLWSSDSTSGFLELSFETVYQKAHNCDLWIGVGTYSTRKQLVAANHRYKLFSPFSSQTIYNYDRRIGARGGNEFLELGYLRPDIILKDLVSIAHPDLAINHELFFYRKLE